MAVHEVADGLVIFTGARWSANFRGGAAAELVRSGQTVRVTGELVQDPAQLGRWLREVLNRGVPARQVGLSIAHGHTPTDEEAAAVRRAVKLKPAP